jgi:hypothetical protein
MSTTSASSPITTPVQQKKRRKTIQLTPSHLQNTTIQKRYWKRLVEEDEDKYMNMRQDCFRHSIDTFHNECDLVKSSHKGDETLLNVQQFILSQHKEWEQIKQKTCMIWWKQLPVVIVQCDSSMYIVDQH